MLNTKVDLRGKTKQDVYDLWSKLNKIAVIASREAERKKFINEETGYSTEDYSYELMKRFNELIAEYVTTPGCANPTMEDIESLEDDYI